MKWRVAVGGYTQGNRAGGTYVRNVAIKSLSWPPTPPLPPAPPPRVPLHELHRVALNDSALVSLFGRARLNQLSDGWAQNDAYQVQLSEGSHRGSCGFLVFEKPQFHEIVDVSFEFYIETGNAANQVRQCPRVAAADVGSKTRR